MVQRVRDLERSMGDGIKRVEDNERETVVLQRRALRASADLAAGTLLTTEHLAPLRPCPVGAIEPNDLDRIIGRKIRHDLEKGSHLEWTDIE
jgi:N-acetylneuraminate synthase